MKNLEESKLLEDLVGEELSSVSFVQDYVQFDFNGPLLTSFADPIVQVEDQTLRFPEGASRDKPCSLIGQQVMTCY